MKTRLSDLNYGDTVYSTLHGCPVRFVRWEGDYAVVMGTNDLRELPDQVHPSQLRYCGQPLAA